MTTNLFPNRPEHPDFKALAAIVRAQDARADEQIPLDQIVGEMADPDTVLYVAEQRALRAVSNTSGESAMTVLMSMWIDAFVAGCSWGRSHP